MWLGYGYNPYDKQEKKFAEVFLAAQKEKHDMLQNAYKEILKDQPEDGHIENINVAYTVEPNQTHLDLENKGIYLQISETFPEEMVAKSPEAVVFQSPYEGSEEDSGYYTSREQYFSSSGSPVTESLAKKLGFSTEARKNIGQLAIVKPISEAVVMIPYLEKPFSIFSKVPNSTRNPWPPLPEDLTESPLHGAENTKLRLMMGTKQIIPGYHFLAIDDILFENFLNTILIDHLTHAKSSVRQELTNKYENYESAFEAVKRTDLGKMIDLLLGRGSTSKLGYMLPPELDFINNSAISPFQMAIVPFDHTFKANDLKHIWQNLAPDKSHLAEKQIKEIAFSPTSMRLHADSLKKDLLDFSPNGVDVKSPALYLTCPGQFLNSISLASGLQDNAAEALVYRNPENMPADPAEFFEKLKWLTFKVKARAAQDYDSYKKRQLDVALSAKGFQRGQQGDLDFTGLDCLSTKEIYGANWPYDFFSLVERAKVEIEYEVPG
jgi:hypothetical protein